MAAIHKAGKQALRFGRAAFSSMLIRNAVHGPCWPSPSGRGRRDEPAAAGPAAAPGLSGDAEGSRGGGGFYYFSALAPSLAAREGSVMVAVATGRLPGNARAGPGRRCRVTGPRGSAAPLPR